MEGPWAPGRGPGGNGNGHAPGPSAGPGAPAGAPGSPGTGVAANVKGKAAGMTTKEKVEQDCLKLIQAVQELKQAGEEQSLRSIAARAGMSKDEVNRYLNPVVRELYDYERLLHVRKRNRPLYNWLIVSGPPKVDEGKWAGIMANTSKYGLFQAVALKYGWVAKHLGQRGAIIDLEYHGIEGLTEERVGKAFRRQEAVMGIDDYLPPANPGPGAGS